LAEELLEQILVQFWGNRVIAVAVPEMVHPNKRQTTRVWDVRVPHSSRKGVEAHNRQLLSGEDYGFNVALQYGEVFDFSEPRNAWEKWAMRKVRQEVAKTLLATITEVPPEEYVLDFKDTLLQYALSCVPDGRPNDWTQYMAWTAPEGF